MMTNALYIDYDKHGNTSSVQYFFHSGYFDAHNIIAKLTQLTMNNHALTNSNDLFFMSFYGDQRPVPSH